MHKKELFKKYLKGQLSEEEFEQLMAELSRAEDSNAYEQALEQLWQETGKNFHLSQDTSHRMLADFRLRRQEVIRSRKEAFLRKVWYGAAAVVALFATGMVLWMLLGRQQTMEYITAYGETRTLTLPDSTTVILNANSSLTYQDNWHADEPREVWLDGEAYFSVVHTRNHQRFLVNVTDDFTVEVLGTEFNVKDRREKTQVVLNTGKVRLDIREPDKAQTVTMQPGELVEFSGIDKSLVKKQVNPELYAAWRHHKMIFEEMPLQEIARVLEDNYGVAITIEDSTLANTRLTGAFPTHNLDMIFTSLPTVVEMEVVKNKDEIIFKNK